MRQPLASSKYSYNAASLAYTTYFYCGGCKGACLNPNTIYQKVDSIKSGVGEDQLGDKYSDYKDHDVMTMKWTL